MIRIVLVLLIVFLLLGLARKLIAPAAKQQRGTGEKLVKCYYCGVYISEASAVSGGNVYFCSDNHRALSQG